MVFHDLNDLRLIYGVVTFEKSVAQDVREAVRQKERLVQERRELQEIFRDLSEGGTDPARLSARHRELLDRLRSWGYSISSESLRERAEKIRYQRGIKEKFSEGIIRSGRYLPLIESIFRREGLPAELALLPHVESSFDHRAYSRSAAAGIWQFIPSTGRRFLTINALVDERLDPIRSSEAAAQLLKENYLKLGNWPLAITAYNHGANGMLRAKQLHGPDLRLIIERHQSPSFSFASQNFYAEFLAAVEVARNHTKYFGRLDIAKPLRFDALHLKRDYAVRDFTRVSGLSEAILKDYNPQITGQVWGGTRSLPAGLPLRVPPGRGAEAARRLNGARPASDLVLARAGGSVRYRVQPGDTLTAIARRFGTSVTTILSANQISDQNRIHLGRILLIPRLSQPPRGS